MYTVFMNQMSVLRCSAINGSTSMIGSANQSMVHEMNEMLSQQNAELADPHTVRNQNRYIMIVLLFLCHVLSPQMSDTGEGFLYFRYPYLCL